MTTPLMVACPCCAAQFGESCKELDHVIAYFHPERVEAAAFVEGVLDGLDDEPDVLPITDELIEKTGLV